MGIDSGTMSLTTGDTCSMTKFPATTETNTNNVSRIMNFNGFVSLSMYLISRNFAIKNMTDMNPAAKNILSITIHFYILNIL